MQASPNPFDVSVTIVQGVPTSADWHILWQRLLAPLPAEIAPEASERAPHALPGNGVPDLAIEAYTAAALEVESR